MKYNFFPDINECAEAIDDLCTAEGSVCHNTAGSFKCVPIKKREVPAITCPPGFKRNIQNQVCDGMPNFFFYVTSDRPRLRTGAMLILQCFPCTIIYRIHVRIIPRESLYVLKEAA
jgi:hypothetical protein